MLNLQAQRPAGRGSIFGVRAGAETRDFAIGGGSGAGCGLLQFQTPRNSLGLVRIGGNPVLGGHQWGYISGHFWTLVDFGQNTGNKKKTQKNLTSREFIETQKKIWGESLLYSASTHQKVRVGLFGKSAKKIRKVQHFYFFLALTKSFWRPRRHTKPGVKTQGITANDPQSYLKMPHNVPDALPLEF